MKPPSSTSRSETQTYTLFGVLFGMVFPILGTLLRVADQGLPLNWNSIVLAQTSDKLLWIIDTAPLFLGLIAAYAGRRQDQTTQLNLQLNRREHELELAQANLEQRIHERTIQLVDRATQLRAVSEVARTIAAVQDTATLLPEITKLVSERFGFYHIGIFLVDSTNQFVILRASNSDGGKKLLDAGHKLKLDATSIVGYVATRGEYRVARDVETDDMFSPNPELSATRAEMALPLQISGRIIGVLDVQSSQPDAFTGDSIVTLEIMADQIAIAIENARLFSEVENALAESQITIERFARKDWNAYVSLAKNTGYLYDGNRTLPVNTKNPSEKVKTLAQTGRLSLAKEASELVVPIRYRGQTVGFLDVKSKRTQRQWTRDEIALLESAAERAALALENARLVEGSQRRAARERIIGEISSKLGSVTDLDAIMQTAVEELGRRLPNAAEIALELETTDASNQDVA